MSDDKSIKLFAAAKELNIGTGTIVDFLGTKGFKVLKHPATQLDGDMYNALLKEFAVDKIIKEEAKQISIGKIRKEEVAHVPDKPVEQHRRGRDFENEEILIKNIHNFSPAAERPKPAEQPKPEKKEEHSEALPGVKVVGKIDLDNPNARVQPVTKPVEKKEPEVIKEEPKEVKPPVVEPPKQVVTTPPPVEEKKEIILG